AVQTNDWEVGVDVGPAWALRTDKKYMTAPSPNDPAKTIVVEDTDGESDGRLAIATLTHFYLPGQRFANGPVAGFSILSSGTDQQQSNLTQYYIGWGFGLGPRKSRLNFAVGGAYAAVPTLPKGFTLNQVTTDPTKIDTLRNTYKWRLF